MQRQIHINKKQLQLVELSSMLKSLNERAANNNREVKNGFDYRVKVVEGEIEVFRNQLNRASIQVGKTYGEIESGLNISWNSLKQSYEAVSEYVY